MSAAGHTALPDKWRVERSIAAIESEWRALEAEAIATPFQSYAWMSSLVSNEEAARDAVFVLGYREGRPRILFPLSLWRGTLTWLNEKWTNYNLPLVASDLFRSLDADSVDRLWSDVRTALGGPAASILRRQPIDIGGAINPFARWAKVEDPTRIYQMTLGPDWPSLYERLYGQDTRWGLERKLKRLKRGGDFVWARVTDPQAIGQYIELLLTWKSDQLDAIGRRNPFFRPEDRRLFAQFGANFPERVRVYAGHLGDRPVAINFVMEDKSRPLLYQMAYEDGPVAKYSPGTLLLNHTLQELIAEKHTLLDFSVGDDPYKRELCNLTGGMTSSVRAHSLTGLPVVLKERAWVLLKAAVKSNPALHGLALRANARLNAWAGRGPRASE